MTSGPTRPDLSAERTQVQAVVAGSGLNADPHLEADVPLRSLPPAVEAKLAARVQAPAAALDPRRRVVGPSAALAGLDLVAVIVAAVTGHVVLAIVAAVLFVPLAGLAVMGARFAANRLSFAERQQVAAASSWRSRQAWTGRGEERGLVIAAVDAAGRIARSPAWRSGRLDEQRVRLDLAAELDQIDEQAHRIADARANGADVGAAWDAALDRVAALTAYANELDGYAQRRRAELARQDPVATEQLLAGTAGDQLALEQLAALTAFLDGEYRGDATQP